MIAAFLSISVPVWAISGVFAGLAVVFALQARALFRAHRQLDGAAHWTLITGAVIERICRDADLPPERVAEHFTEAARAHGAEQVEVTIKEAAE